jgi:hypothetical protein
MCNKRDYLDALEFEYSFTFRFIKRYLFVKTKESINQKYHSVIGISYGLAQSDPIKRCPL